MIKKEFIDYLSDKLNIKRKELIEKDLILQLLLNEIESDNYFRNNFAFKGGTCLIKCYLGYYRFSEDIDFTWINQREFEKKSQKSIRRNISEKVNKIIEILQKAAGKLDLDFKPEKKNKKYFEFGGGNKFTTFKLWYNSSVLNVQSFIKIQINFVELIMFPIIKCRVRSIITRPNIKEINFLFPEYVSLFSKKLIVNTYDIKEILVEKIRAVLTRRAIKARDFIDVFLITAKQNIELKKLEKDILTKTRFMLRYQKYVKNLKEFQVEEFLIGEEEKFLLKPVGKGFNKFIMGFRVFINNLAEKATK